ncbi:MAG: DUF5615 family PIN-like protein [Pleurocapsa sp. SU_5_0]|nr:DUF5615 family PIN-like protein [Pleurocapsa sp. SU_5_0]NJR48121.1 DUF5615 family PIN-like protein [Hyellaceae cyanobacterium CSU_1_1]
MIRPNKASIFFLLKLSPLLKSRGLDVTTVPEQATLGKTDSEQLEIATSFGRCLLTHNRIDFERLHLQYINENKQHSGIIIVPQKNPYKVARRIGILVSALTVEEINNQLLYA